MIELRSEFAVVDAPAERVFSILRLPGLVALWHHDVASCDSSDGRVRALMRSGQTIDFIAELSGPLSISLSPTGRPEQVRHTLRVVPVDVRKSVVAFITAAVGDGPLTEGGAVELDELKALAESGDGAQLF